MPQHLAEEVARRAATERAYMEASGIKTLINCLSGGVDSTAAALICQRAAPGRALGLILPCSTEPERTADVDDARRVAAHLGLPAATVDLTQLWQAAVSLFAVGLQNLCREAGIVPDEGRLEWAANNLKPALRMAAAGYFSDALLGMTIGTTNAIEYFLGYFSVRGDGAADRQPLRDCTKAEVRDIAGAGGFAPDLIERTPTAGLWPGQNDERELGFSYAEADAFFVWLLNRHRAQPLLDDTFTVPKAAAAAILDSDDLPVPVQTAGRMLELNQRSAYKRRFPNGRTFKMGEH